MKRKINNKGQDKKSKIFSLSLKKQGQDKKLKIPSLCSKRAQEEMVGFALIIIIIAVILLIFITFTITRQETEVESYEVESFVQSMLSYTTDCSDYSGKVAVDRLIKKCKDNEKCIDERDTCDVLKDTISGMVEESWKVGRGGILGYELNISIKGENIISVSEGNKTKSYKGSSQPYKDINIVFNAYY